jgi:adenosylhomocysteine nucleosidase
MGVDSKWNKIVILAAFRVEVEELAERLEDKSALGQAGFLRYVTGRIEDLSILIGTAGMGKVRASAAAQKAIDLLEPDALLCCGTAGSLKEDVRPLDLVVAERLLQHDTGPDTPPWIDADPALTDRLERAAHDVLRVTPSSMHRGGLITGDRPVLDRKMRQELSRRFDALAVDMEAAAAVEVARGNDVPACVIKAITDSADEDGRSDFKKNVKEGAGLAQRAAHAFLTQAAR